MSDMCREAPRVSIMFSLSLNEMLKDNLADPLSQA